MNRSDTIMKSFFVVASLCVFLTAVCSAQSKVDNEETDVRDTPCRESIRQVLNTLKEIADMNRGLIDQAAQIARKFITCIREQQNLPKCRDLVVPDLNALRDEFLRINKDSVQRIADKVRDAVKTCSQQYFLGFIQTGFLAY